MTSSCYGAGDELPAFLPLNTKMPPYPGQAAIMNPPESLIIDSPTVIPFNVDGALLLGKYMVANDIMCPAYRFTVDVRACRHVKVPEHNFTRSR